MKKKWTKEKIMNQETVKKKTSESQRVYIVSSLCSKDNRKCDHEAIEAENERLRLSFYSGEPPITYFCPICGEQIPNAGILAHSHKAGEPFKQYSLDKDSKTLKFPNQ